MGRTLYVSSKLTYIMTNTRVWSDASWTMGRTLYVSSKPTYIMTNMSVWSDASVNNGPYFVRKQQANLYNDEHAWSDASWTMGRTYVSSKPTYNDEYECMERRLREQWAVLCT
ncbi:hypothetical protein EVAR_20314_1 [Eumeta japonica]|uniref:Uncharacterized protein n=1 Tax=Eumeta variegata TaxID=151549 RepID=A0A4C1VNR1_EUMVA|nr:hypothetical protein EVAR_20314_1 [Eumeta japonica]